MALTQAQSDANAAMTASGNYTFANGEVVNSAAQSKGGSGVTNPTTTPVSTVNADGTRTPGLLPGGGMEGVVPSTPVYTPPSNGGDSKSTSTPPKTTSKTAAPSSPPTGSDQGNAYLLGESDDSVNFELNPNGPDNLEDKEYQRGIQEAQPSIAAAQDAYDAEIKRTEDQGVAGQGATIAKLISSGTANLAGNALGKSYQKTTDDVNVLMAQRGQAVQSILDNVRSTAQSNARTDASNAISYVKSLGQNYISLQEFKSEFPDEYDHVLASFGGDENALIASGAISAPKVLNSYVQGDNYVQTVQDPVTGKVMAQTFTLSVEPPVGWSSEKLTNAIVFTDPSNAANSITYTTDPLTGALTVNGTGTGLQTLSDAGVPSGSSSGGASQGGGSTGTTNASTTIASMLGVSDPTAPMSSVVESSGLGNMAAAFIKNEGGTPQGTNNPYNIKFAGQPGATQGKAATDGGYFANFNTRGDADAAFGNMVNKAAASGTSLQDFVNSYTGQGSSSTQSTVAPETGLDTREYGLLAKVSGFDPTKPGVDSAAWNYLNQFLTQGKTPTATSVGISLRTGSGAAFNAVAQRASDLYFQATGKHLPNGTTLDSNLKLISGNNSLLNSLNVQEKTIAANSALLQANMTADDVNNNAPAINGILDQWKNLAGDPGVASYLAQNSTLSNELGSLLALKNASGTTVHDKLISADLIDKNATPEQEAAVVNTLMKEAQNARTAIGQASAQLYEQTDPLGLDPNNPVSSPGYEEMTASGAQNAYDGTWVVNGVPGYKVQGTQLVDPNGVPVANLQ